MCCGDQNEGSMDVTDSDEVVITRQALQLSHLQIHPNQSGQIYQQKGFEV